MDDTPEPLRGRYAIDAGAGVIELAGDPSPGLRDFRATLEALLDDPAFRPGLAILEDRRHFPDPPSTWYVWEVVRWRLAHAHRLGRGKWALVTAGLAGYGVARMEALLADSFGLRVAAFLAPEEARRWLADDPPS